MADPLNEVQTEQKTVDLLYARLDALRKRARSRLARVRRSGPSGSPQNRSERDAFATLYEDRVAQLEAVEDRLCFGRLDLQDGTVRHIGRIGLTDENHSSLLTDWRAPAAQAFYRATAAHPDDVVRRRHLVTRGRNVVSLEDEILDLSLLDSAEAHELGHLSGEAALLAAMSAGRTGRMGDIVATIQSEQDEIIRAPLSGALVVQGGPGTGKTAVALHRAAYLLYAHRKQLERSGVLLIGPSAAFLGYIDQVLPSLGETGVVSTTIGRLFPGVVAEDDDDAVSARLKGDATFARVIRRAIRARQRVPNEDLEIVIDGVSITIRRDRVARAIAHARRLNRPHNRARTGFVKEMLADLADQFFENSDTPIDPEDRAAIIEELRTTRDVRVALNLAWFPLTPEGLLRDLFSKPHRLAEAAPHLSAQECKALLRPASAAWTVSDVPLLDEAAELLGSDDTTERAARAARAQQRDSELAYARQVLENSSASALVSAQMLADRFTDRGPSLTTAERAIADRSWTYGHVIVDEAQELSAMAWRMLRRRCPTQSMTIVGDVAQTANSAGARSWGSMLDPILRTWRIAELTINYRTPAAVAEAAQDLAAAAGLPISPLTSAREVDNALERVTTAPETLNTVLTQVLRRVASERLTGGSGRIAVIAEPARVAPLSTSISRTDLAELLGTSSASGPRTDAPLAVLTPRQSKGLEFDAVILIEPATVGSPSDLYVAMTRPTQQLIVLTTGSESTALPATHN